MKREVRICSGWPDDEAAKFSTPELIHAAREDWVIFFREESKYVHCMLMSEWKSVTEAARLWMNGGSVQELLMTFP